MNGNIYKCKLLFCCVLGSLLLSCVQEENDNSIVEDYMVRKVFDAMLIDEDDSSETKVSLDGSYESKNRAVLWNPKDEVAVFDHGTFSVAKFINISEKSATSCVLEGITYDAEDYSALYPYDIVSSADEDNVYFTLPSVQHYYEDNIDASAFPMIARLDGNTFNFKNICGVLVLQIQGDGTVKSISFKGYDTNSNLMKVAGDAYLNHSYSSIPSLQMDEGAVTQVELSCGTEGVTLSESESTPFHIILPPATYSSFELKVVLADGRSMMKSADKPLTIQRSMRTTASVFDFEDFTSVTGVTLDKTSLELTEGDEATLRATLTPDNASNKNVTWTSGDTEVATVENGKVTAVKAGTTTITVTTEDGGKTATCEVIVNANEYIDLSLSGTANSYIVSASGSYKFTPTKGNSSTSVGAIASVCVLWESFGTNVTPNVGDLVKNAVYSDGYIAFQTSDTFREGNAVIAAKDASGNILWSWHIWLTDEPQGQEYYNNAGTMMDRNLGATSSTPGDVGALGLLYQWGRKDPFLGSSNISEAMGTASTISWPSAVESNASNGTIEYAILNPTIFINYNSSNRDWYYTGSSSIDNSLWTASDKAKSIYDPCPDGWRVPDGGDRGVWSIAIGSSSSFSNSYDSSNEGMNFSDQFSSNQTIWYPASGYRYDDNDTGLFGVGSSGYYWSASPYIDNSYYAYSMYFNYNVNVNPSDYNIRALGCSVRCVREGTGGNNEIPVSYVDINTTSLEMYEGDVYQLTLTILPTDATNKEVVWGSSNSEVANVSNTGLVTALSYGTAIISATVGKLVVDCYISVNSHTTASADYIDEFGINHGKGIAIGETIWAPVNCGYHKTDCSYGKLYQWGRKYGQNYDSSSYSISLGGISLTTGQSEENKNVFYTGLKDISWDWLYPFDNTLWNIGTETEPIKNIDNDPCPSGWRVPTNNELDNLRKNRSDWVKVVSQQWGYWFSGPTLYSEGVSRIFLSAGGMHSASKGEAQHIGSWGGYWSSLASGSSYGYLTAHMLYFDEYRNVGVSRGYRAEGLLVRCVQE